LYTKQVEARIILLDIMRGGIYMRKESNQFYLHLFGYFSNFLKFTLLAIIIILFGSHESANPKIGQTKIEFNISEFREQMFSGSNSSLQNRQGIIDDLVKKFYAERQYMPAWTLNFKTNEAFTELTGLLKSAKNYGLVPSFYSVNKLADLEIKMKNLNLDEEKLRTRIELEKTATTAALLFMLNISVGIDYSDTNTLTIELTKNFATFLNANILSGNIKPGILSLQPQSDQYKYLQKALVKILDQATYPKQTLSSAEILRFEGLLEKILVEKGYLNIFNSNDSLEKANAIKRFQKIHAISETGTPDSITIALMDVSREDIFNQIAINLDRMRNEEIKKENCILVNIPEFKLYYSDPMGRHTEYTVVVGKKFSPTPLLSSRIESIVANPHWTVPNSIAVNEIIPQIQTDSTYLRRNGFKIVDKDANAVNEAEMDWSTMNPASFKYYIRQDNSEKSALGNLKFLFPNMYSVYLHDTPSKRFFKKGIRAYSHGCVRVENPERLAQQIISAYCSEGDKNLLIDKLIKTGKQKNIKLAEPLAIYIKYYTCTADSFGNINFHPDIYTYDEASIADLFAKIDRE
jgi:murein L,D-transpeptidase YcbB/YkuD